MAAQSLKGTTALITGSVQGIGLEIAKALAAEGVRIGVHGLAGEEAIATACREIVAAGAPDARFFGGDLRDIAQIETLMNATENWGPVDILVNNAGTQRTAAMREVTPELFNSIISVNLTAPFFTMRRVLPGMAQRGFGRVINIASVHGLVASKDKAPYVASKFGLVGMSRVAALEFASAGSRETGGVTVNCICPGWTETALIEPQIQARASLHGGDRQAGVASLLAEKQPTLRTSHPDEIGMLVTWLCDRRAHNITGTAIPIDGGWTAQ